jgi:UDP-N-acetylglucosamine 2-epimerase (non-hydrolysing)
MKVLVVLGTRPEAIKMAPVVDEARHRGIDVEVCVTAQHRSMLDQALGLFGIVPDRDLDLMVPNQTLAGLTARAMTALDALIAASQPDWLLVQGDTTTALVAALCAFYHRVRVGHVEAGLRTYDLARPFPEELNRRVADAVSTAHFVPTEGSAENLRREGIDEATIYLTGNTVVDALQTILRRPPPEGFAAEFGDLARGGRLVLVTAHRRESFGSGMEQIARALLRISRAHPDVQIVYPVHRNPNVRSVMHDTLSGVPRVHLIDPLDYLSFVHLMARAHLILSDSGGVQEEAPSLGVPALVLRETTERPEAIAAGATRLVGVEEDPIFAAADELLSDSRAHARMARAVNPYGDGRAAQRIVSILCGEAWSPFASGCG